MLDLNRLITETRNSASMHIDACSTIEMLQIINEADKTVANSIERILPEIAEAVDCITAHLKKGGHLFYLGAGTSGRLGILDASECPPTYGTAPDLVQGIIAGGYPAIFQAQEGAEDSLTLAEQDLSARQFSQKDVLVGIAASGRTPYVIGGLLYANKIGAATIALSCTPASEIAALAQIALTPIVGPEIITGSTRMKAGTAQKMILNMLSTAAMIHLGKVYKNLMVDLSTSNKKLEERARRIVMEATDCSRTESIQALSAADGNAKLAIFFLLSGLPIQEARHLLEASDGYIQQAILALHKS